MPALNSKSLYVLKVPQYRIYRDGLNQDDDKKKEGQALGKSYTHSHPLLLAVQY